MDASDCLGPEGQLESFSSLCGGQSCYQSQRDKSLSWNIIHIDDVDYVDGDGKKKQKTNQTSMTLTYYCEAKSDNYHIGRLLYCFIRLCL